MFVQVCKTAQQSIFHVFHMVLEQPAVLSIVQVSIEQPTNRTLENPLKHIFLSQFLSSVTILSFPLFFIHSDFCCCSKMHFYSSFFPHSCICVSALISPINQLESLPLHNLCSIDTEFVHISSDRWKHLIFKHQHEHCSISPFLLAPLINTLKQKGNPTYLLLIMHNGEEHHTVQFPIQIPIPIRGGVLCVQECIQYINTKTLF